MKEQPHNEQKKHVNFVLRDHVKLKSLSKNFVGHVVCGSLISQKIYELCVTCATLTQERLYKHTYRSNNLNVYVRTKNSVKKVVIIRIPHMKKLYRLLYISL